MENSKPKAFTSQTTMYFVSETIWLLSACTTMWQPSQWRYAQGEACPQIQRHTHTVSPHISLETPINSLSQTCTHWGHLQSRQSNHRTDSKKMKRTYRENGFVKITLRLHTNVRTHKHSLPNINLNIIAYGLKVKPVMTVFYRPKVATLHTLNPV